MTSVTAVLTPTPAGSDVTATTLAEVYARDATNTAVLVLDGHGLRLGVERGHLLLHDGIGVHRRSRRLSRAQRTVRRIVVLGHTGHLTLDAVRWCAEVGIALVQLDTDGDLLAVAGATDHDDSRLRRAQALAPDNPAGLGIARALLAAKVTGQAAVCNENLALPTAGYRLTALADQLAQAPTVNACRDIEATAANAYFGAWAGRVTVRFASRDTGRVPEHWHVFTARRSPLLTGKSPRKAADPVNALLNYGYALGEIECTLALRAVGLDPGLGIVHTDHKHRDSLALDLLEALRPVIDARVLALLGRRHLRASDFHETADGTCRLLAPLTHELAGDLPYYARTVAPHAEAIAHALAQCHPAPVQLRTPLTKANARAVQTRGGKRTSAYDPKPPPATASTCRTCGVPLTHNKRQLCATCWPITRARLATERAALGVVARASQRARGETDPAQSEQARAKRHSSLVTMKAAEAAWNAEHPDEPQDPAWYAEHVQPNLTGVPLSRLQQATGLSASACSRIRTGQLQPHPRHWTALAALPHLDEQLKATRRSSRTMHDASESGR